MGKATIRISQEAKNKLRSIRRGSETDEDVIELLLQLYDDKYGKAHKELDKFHIN